MMMALLQIPIFAPEQLTDEMNEAWAQAATDNPPSWLECLPLRNEDGSIACVGPVGFIPVEVMAGVANG